MRNITKNKRSTRASDLRKNILLKSKRSQEIFGLSFSMIFSIILIVFLIISAFVAIKFFLGWQKKMQIGTFFDSVSSKVSEVLNSGSADITKKYSLPSGIEDVCFIDLNNPAVNANTDEKDIYTYIFNQGGVQNFKNNVYLYAPDMNYALNWKTITHINNTEKNPICAPVKDGIVSLRFQRKPEGYSVYVSAA